MQHLWISFLLILFNWSISIHAKAIIKGPANETLLVGQIHGPPGDAARNLLGMILSMNVFYNNTLLHSSLIPITNGSFPLNYSIVLNEHDFKLEHAKHFGVISMIWQPTYLYKANISLPENGVDTLNFEMRNIKFIIIRGEIIHEKHASGTDLPAREVKLEVIEENEKGHVIDQVDFICTSKKYPCPFEYWLDTSHIKPHTNYRLEAILAERRLPFRKSIHQKHQVPTVETKSTKPASFQINSTVNTEINDYKIIVG